MSKNNKSWRESYIYIIANQNEMTTIWKELEFGKIRVKIGEIWSWAVKSANVTL